MWALFIGVSLLAITTDVESRYTYQPAINGSLTQHKVIATWEEAYAQCHSEGAELAVPSSAELLTALTSLISSHGHSTPYFIGVRATEALGRYVSAHNVSLDDMPQEVTDMIEKIDPRDGDCMSLSPDSIHAVPCWSRLPFICYINERQEDDQATPQNVVTTPQSVETTTEKIDTTEIHIDSLQCESGYTFYPATGRCYKKNPKIITSNWNTANSTCAEEGGYLVIINDKAEAEFIMHELYSGDIGEPVWWIWIGIHDDEKGEWKSVLGEPVSGLYSEWDGVTRDNAHCGAFHLGGEVKKYYCDDYFRILCERDPIQDQDANKTQDILSSTEATVPYCDKGYIYYPEISHCYKNHGLVSPVYPVYSPSTRWSDANDLCDREGGYLNIINDKAEAEFIMNVIYPLYTDGRYRERWWMWTGLHDVGNGTDDWRSIHGEPVSDLYHNWDGLKFEDDVDPYCGTLHLKGQLRKSECIERRVNMLVLCEKEPNFIN